MEVQQTVSAMIDRPADFDQLMAPLVRSLLTNVQDDITLNAIVSELFTQVSSIFIHLCLLVFFQIVYRLT